MMEWKQNKRTSHQRYAVVNTLILGCCTELCVKSSGVDTGRNDTDHENENENQYVNSIALAAANDEQTSGSSTNTDGNKCEDSLAIYQDLSTDANGSGEPRVYESIRPRIMPKPRAGQSNNA